jgi:hypothetical protein
MDWRGKSIVLLNEAATIKQNTCASASSVDIQKLPTKLYISIEPETRAFHFGRPIVIAILRKCAGCPLH